MFAEPTTELDSLLMFSVALIRHPEQLEASWLSILNESGDELSLITATRSEGTSWRDCLDQKIADALLVRRGKDYIISKMPRLNFEDVIQVGTRQQQMAVAFFVVDLYGRNARAAIDHDPRTVWVSNRELRQGISDSGIPFAPHMCELLRRSDVIRNF